MIIDGPSSKLPPYLATDLLTDTKEALLNELTHAIDQDDREAAVSLLDRLDVFITGLISSRLPASPPSEG